jgi:hypothetical protein
MADMGHSPAQWTLPFLEIGTWGGTFLLIIGLCYYAKSKGQHPAWGLFGFLSFIGVAILYFLENKTTTQRPNTLLRFWLCFFCCLIVLGIISGLMLAGLFLLMGYRVF